MQPPSRLQFDASQRVSMKNYHLRNQINASQPLFDFLLVPRLRVRDREGSPILVKQWPRGLLKN